MTVNYKIEMINEAFEYDLNSFCCGEQSLDIFVRQHLLRQHQRNILRGYVLITNDQMPKIVGYYTLSGSSFERESLPSKSQQKKIPYSNAPAITLGRLAIDTSLQGNGYGAILVAHAMKVVSKASDAVGIHGMFVDALNEGARKFYRQLGFTELKSPNENSLFIPTSSIKLLYP